MTSFHLVIPAFEESVRLPAYLDELAGDVEALGFPVRILVVDDGSSAPERDALARTVNDLASRHPSILPPLLLPENQGKGGAILAGWSAGHDAKWFGFVDADGATPSREVVRVLTLAAARVGGPDCFFASRIKLLGRRIERKMSRHLMGRVYATLVGSLIHPGVYDSQCGFKLLSARAFAATRAVISEKRFAFDVDLLAALIEAGMSIEEIPIDWKDIPGSKVSFVKDTVRMFVSLLRIRTKRKQRRAAASQADRVAVAVETCNTSVE
jgi:glycosyltransferase involved in cell wall biosynthesis